MRVYLWSIEDVSDCNVALVSLASELILLCEDTYNSYLILTI